MQRFLGREGFRVVATAARGGGAPAGAGDRAGRHHPGRDDAGHGRLGVLAALKADTATADIPVIMVTIVDDRNLGFALGAADYLTKPIDRERLVAVLARHRPAAARRSCRRRRSGAARAAPRARSSSEGWAVHEAADGRSALARIERSAARPDPARPDDAGDGRLRVRWPSSGRPEWRGIPVVVVTAKDLTPEERQRLNGRVERFSPRARWGEALLPRSASWWPLTRRRAPRRQPIVSHRRTRRFPARGQ